MLKVGTVVYTTRRSPFSNKTGYRKGVVKRIEHSILQDEDLIWCVFGKLEGTEAYTEADINVCLFTDTEFSKYRQKNDC